MTFRSGHGRGRGVPRIEVMPVDELPEGSPAPAHEESPSDRKPGGAFAPGNSLASRGGRARQGQTRLANRLGLASLPAGSDWAPYKASATSFRKAQCAALAATVGAGFCGPGPSSLVASAALQLAWSRYLSDKAAETGDSDGALKASRLADASRQSLMAAHELCAREGEARAKAHPQDHGARLLEAFGSTAISEGEKKP